MQYLILSFLIPLIGCVTTHEQSVEEHSLKTKAAMESMAQCNFPEALSALSSIDDTVLRFEWSYEGCGPHRIDSYPTEIAIEYVKRMGKEISREFKKCGSSSNFESIEDFDRYKTCVALVSKVDFPYDDFVKGRHSEYKDEKKVKKFMRVAPENLPFCDSKPVIQKCVEKKLESITQKFQKKQAELKKSESRSKTLQPLRLGICALEEKLISLRKMKGLPETENATKKQRYDLDMQIINLEEQKKLAILGYQATGEKWSDDNCSTTMEMINPDKLLEQQKGAIKQSL